VSSDEPGDGTGTAADGRGGAIDPPQHAPGDTVAGWPWLVELAVVLWVSLGASAVRSLLAIINRLTAGISLSDQSASIVVSQTPDRPWLDLAYQVTGIVLALGPVALVWYLLRRSGEGFAGIGFDATQPRRDLLRGTGLAVLVGTIGLGFYLLAYAAGISVQIAAVTAEQFPWTVPVLLGEALQNAVLEEVVILGYFLHRCTQAGLRPPVAVGAAALIRGAYHLYQGFGGFIGNAVMGLFFGWLFLRWRRTTPFVIAHFLIDAAAFVGYLYLRGRVSWLP
jgi:membrane protease YdiL (CAAX protease family)